MVVAEAFYDGNYSSQLRYTERYKASIEKAKNRKIKDHHGSEYNFLKNHVDEKQMATT